MLLALQGIGDLHIILRCRQNLNGRFCTMKGMDIRLKYGSRRLVDYLPLAIREVQGRYSNKTKRPDTGQSISQHRLLSFGRNQFCTGVPLRKLSSNGYDLRAHMKT